MHYTLKLLGTTKALYMLKSEQIFEWAYSSRSDTYYSGKDTSCWVIEVIGHQVNTLENYECKPHAASPSRSFFKRVGDNWLV